MYIEDMVIVLLIYIIEVKRNEEMDVMRKCYEIVVDELFEKIWVFIWWSELEYVEV